jgi:hypothetical protein
MKTKVKDCLEELKGVLDQLEHETYHQTGVSHISGGFVVAKHDGHDIKKELLPGEEVYYYIELIWGVQSDVEDNVHTEYYKISSSILGDPNLSTKEKCNLLEDA